MIAGRYDKAELLVALWKLGAPPNERLPTFQGILDCALQKVRDTLPLSLSSFTFSATGVGLRCYELPDILLAAQEAMLTSASDLAYLSTSVTISREEAEEIVLNHEVDIADAERIGGALFAETARLKSELTKRSDGFAFR